MGKIIKCPVCSSYNIEVIQECTLGECDSCKHLMIIEEHEDTNLRSAEDEALIVAAIKFAKICHTPRSCGSIMMVHAEREFIEAVKKHSNWKEE